MGPAVTTTERIDSGQCRCGYPKPHRHPPISGSAAGIPHDCQALSSVAHPSVALHHPHPPGFCRKAPDVPAPRPPTVSGPWATDVAGVCEISDARETLTGLDVDCSVSKEWTAR